MSHQPDRTGPQELGRQPGGQGHAMPRADCSEVQGTYNWLLERGVRVPLKGLRGPCWVDIRLVKKSWHKPRDLEVQGTYSGLLIPFEGSFRADIWPYKGCSRL